MASDLSVPKKKKEINIVSSRKRKKERIEFHQHDNHFYVKASMLILVLTIVIP